MICDWDGKYSVIVYRNLHPANLHFGIFRPSILGFQALENMGHLSSTCFHVSKTCALFDYQYLYVYMMSMCCTKYKTSIYCLVGEYGIYTTTASCKGSTAASYLAKTCIGASCHSTSEKNNGTFSGTSWMIQSVFHLANEWLITSEDIAFF